ncbi:Y-family DNA polymerase, partial [Paramagnetospirillum caucaseum]
MKNPTLFGLVDCNNFYCSCERVFQPSLEGFPIVVLSNNDGCIIARSNEAKELGVEMGTPYFKARGLIEQHGIKVFSSNYTLYGDMSARVMSVLAESSPDIEVYS